MKILPILSMCFAATLCGTSHAAEWEVLPPAPMALMGLHAETVDDVIFTFGGQPIGGAAAPATGVTVHDVHALDTATGSWAERAPIPTARGFLGTAVVGKRIYVIGGSPNMREFDAGVGTVEIYDPAADAWSFAPQLGVPRADLAASVVDGRIYAIGGTAHVGVDALPTVEMFDPETGVWTRRADMPTPRLHHTSVAFDGEIYVFGGGPEWPVPLASVEIYDPATDSWRAGADMPTPRTGLWAAALGGRIYVAGGLSWDNEALATVEVYDPKEDSWASAPDMPTARFLAATTATEDALYVIGGARTDYATLDAVEVLKVANDGH